MLNKDIWNFEGLGLCTFERTEYRRPAKGEYFIGYGDIINRAEKDCHFKWQIIVPKEKVVIEKIDEFIISRVFVVLCTFYYDNTTEILLITFSREKAEQFVAKQKKNDCTEWFIEEHNVD